jgi:cold shock CspA family protein
MNDEPFAFAELLRDKLRGVRKLAGGGGSATTTKHIGADRIPARAIDFSCGDCGYRVRGGADVYLKGFDGMPMGYVKMFSEKGFGFIRQDGAAGDAGIFFHMGNVIGDLEPQKNDRVEFEIRESARKPGSM